MRSIINKLFLVTALLVVAVQVSAQGALLDRYVEGNHYIVLPEPVPVQDPSKIEVAEVFWYACSHCFRFEPQIRKFEENLAADVNFVRIPAIWQPIMETHARIYYTAKVMGVLDTVHQGVFNTINLDRKQLKDANEVAELFATYGINKDEVLKTFNSGKVTQMLQADMDKVRKYRITGTPQIIVNGQYRVEAKQGISQTEMLNIVDFLVDKVRSEQSKDKE